GIRDRNVTGVQTCALPIYIVLQDLGINRGRLSDFTRYVDCIGFRTAALDDGKCRGFADGVRKYSMHLDKIHFARRYAVNGFNDIPGVQAGLGSRSSGNSRYNHRISETRRFRQNHPDAGSLKGIVVLVESDILGREVSSVGIHIFDQPTDRAIYGIFKEWVVDIVVLDPA